MLRQDPVECLFSFICSSNNHISRIQGMVERLCHTLGPRLVTIQDTHYHDFPTLQALAGKTLSNKSSSYTYYQNWHQHITIYYEGSCGAFYALVVSHNRISVCCVVTDSGIEARLRELCFGYRARFVQQSAQLILDTHSPDWLQQLRSTPYEEAREALRTLPGVGLKVTFFTY